MKRVSTGQEVVRFFTVMGLILAVAGKTHAEEAAAGSDQPGGNAATEATKPKVQKKSAPKKAPPSKVEPEKEAVVTVDPATESAPPRDPSEPASPPPPENTLERCRDQQDNDRDGHVDCRDQDCQIYAICVQGEAPVVMAVPVPPPPPPGPMQERSWQCKDGIDNDENGLTDCHDPECQPLRHCKRIMYERPETPNRAPGLYVNIGMGLALPNYNLPTVETGSDYGVVPFDPDMGVMMGVQVGYLFLKFLGVGLNMQRAFTFASNRSEYFIDWDYEEDYKYQGDKYYGTFGGLLRIQWPFRWGVPYLNAHAGYSASRYEWYVYDGRNSWETIYDWENYGDVRLIGQRDERREPNDGYARHFLFALEPGIEFSVIRRFFSIGIRGWLPVVATKNFSYDNVGIMTSFTFTPMWREKPVLKPEYAK